ncbi:hypothetical protein BKA70DRAFT_1563177 [Coprinopsis sp. MPI-PUGE-AT-0042]|nr:hypothetical protein BKA70DRAFT_1563177 [Coprinopsis sp. MPI-PUGE-AT-0042]
MRMRMACCLQFCMSQNTVKQLLAIALESREVMKKHSAKAGLLKFPSSVIHSIPGDEILKDPCNILTKIAQSDKWEDDDSGGGDESFDLFKPAALSLWMRALQTSHGQTKALGLEAMQKVLWFTPTLFAGNSGVFVPSGATVTEIPPNRLLDNITGSGSLTRPSPIRPRHRRALERRRAQPKPHLYLALVFIALVNRLSRASTPRSRSPLQSLQTRDSCTEESGRGCESGILIRFYSPFKGEGTPKTSSAAEPSLSVPERKLGDAAGEREAAQSDHDLRIHQPRTSTTIATPGPPPAASSSRCYKATRKLSLPSSESLKELRKWIFHPAALAYSRIEHSMKDGRRVARSSMLNRARRVNSTSKRPTTKPYRAPVKTPSELNACTRHRSLS